MVLSSVIYDNVKMVCVEEKNLVKWSQYDLTLKNSIDFKKFCTKFQYNILTAPATTDKLLDSENVMQGVKSAETTSQVLCSDNTSLKGGSSTQLHSSLLKENPPRFDPPV